MNTISVDEIKAATGVIHARIAGYARPLHEIPAGEKIVGMPDGGYVAESEWNDAIAGLPDWAGPALMLGDFLTDDIAAETAADIYRREGTEGLIREWNRLNDEDMERWDEEE